MTDVCFYLLAGFVRSQGCKRLWSWMFSTCMETWYAWQCIVCIDLFTHPQIRYIECLNHLTHLRVLNLAGNDITCVSSLVGLQVLAELNLRRNRITHVVRTWLTLFTRVCGMYCMTIGIFGCTIAVRYCQTHTVFVFLRNQPPIVRLFLESWGYAYNYFPC